LRDRIMNPELITGRHLCEAVFYPSPCKAKKYLAVIQRVTDKIKIFLKNGVTFWVCREYIDEIVSISVRKISIHM
jgi:predicted peroxiredoxin